jgi:hypothetical protein
MSAVIAQRIDTLGNPNSIPEACWLWLAWVSLGDVQNLVTVKIGWKCCGSFSLTLAEFSTAITRNMFAQRWAFSRGYPLGRREGSLLLPVLYDNETRKVNINEWRCKSILYLHEACLQKAAQRWWSGFRICLMKRIQISYQKLNCNVSSKDWENI